MIHGLEGLPLGTQRFDGATFDPVQDGPRLTSLLARVNATLRDGQWHTLAELAQRCGGTEASISARLRDLRKIRFGQHRIVRERVTGGLWRYRMAA